MTRSLVTNGAIGVVSPSDISAICGHPHFPAGFGVHRHRVSVEQVVDDLPVGVGRAPIDQIAAGDPDGVRAHRRTILPPEGVAFLGEVERIQHIRIGRHDVHRVLHHERLPLVASRGRRWRTSRRGAAPWHSSALISSNPL